MGSTSRSKNMATTVWAILSATVGTPRILPPPDAFGISTAFTAGGKYDPYDIRFHSRYRLLLRSCSNCSTDCPSTPAAPLLALTLLYASQTMLFGISNGLTCDFDSLTWLLPGTLVDHQTNPDDPPPSLQPRYRAFITTTRRSVPLPCVSTLPLTVSAAWGSPFRRRRQHARRRHHGEGFPRFVPVPRPGSRHLCAGQPPGQ